MNKLDDFLFEASKIRVKTDNETNLPKMQGGTRQVAISIKQLKLTLQEVDSTLRKIYRVMANNHDGTKQEYIIEKRVSNCTIDQ